MIHPCTRQGECRLHMNQNDASCVDRAGDELLTVNTLLLDSYCQSVKTETLNHNSSKLELLTLTFI